MNYISTTELRTKSSKLKDSLKKGESTYVMHRSKIIGVIEPYESVGKTFNVKQYKKLQAAVPPSKVHYSNTEREKIFSKHLKEKYGKNIS